MSDNLVLSPTVISRVVLIEFFSLEFREDDGDDDDAADLAEIVAVDADQIQIGIQTRHSPAEA